MPLNPQLPIINRSAAAAALLLTLAACEPPRSPENPATPSPSPKPVATPRPSPTPTPVPTIDRKRLTVAELFNGLRVNSRVEFTRSPETASQDRTQPESYRLELTLHADVPAPSRTLEQVSRNDPTLPAALPGLAERLATARVSPAFEQIYALKLDYLKARLGRLDTLLTLHNLYDCETILELENPATGGRALFLQGDMDVNTDGSDGDRNFAVDGRSMFFQPQTSYRWKRLTKRPNQFLNSTKAAIAKIKGDLAGANLTAARRNELRGALEHEQSTLYEIERYSFLISGADPFIVLPGFMLRDAKGPFAPAFGDYAVVVYNGVAYPAILGDAGPSYKFGEASVRLCRQINPSSSANSRPVSSLKVTYLVFPGSKDADAGPPDLEKWRARCAELLDRLGLRPANLHAWENLIKPWPTPTPVPTPTPTPPATPSPTPTPEATSSPEPVPTPTTPATPPVPGP